MTTLTNVKVVALGALILMSQGFAVPVVASPQLLRYHLEAHEAITYRVTYNGSRHMKLGKGPAQDSTSTDSFTMRYNFGYIGVDGSAPETVTFSVQHVIVTTNGKTTRSTAPVRIDNAVQKVDGEQTSNYQGAYGLNDLGILPTTPIDVGGSWKSGIDNTVYIVNHARLQYHNTLVRFLASPKGPMADIHTIGDISGPAQFAESGTNYDVLMHEKVDGRWQFAVAPGIFVSETLRQTIIMGGSETGSQGKQPVASTIVTTTSMQLISITQGH